MKQEQFENIKRMAWDWYRGNMSEWAVKTLKNIQDSPEWVKELFNDPMFEPLRDEDFLKEYSADIDHLLATSQTRNFGVNYTKEILEFQEALRDNNEYEMIDALCDMIIVMCNSNFGFKACDYDYFIEEKIDIMGNLGEEFDIFHTHIEGIALHIRAKGYDPYKCLLETIKELESRTGAWNEKEGKWCKDIGAYTLNELNRDLVANIYGEDHEYWYFTPRLGKELGMEVGKVKKWYKADYSKCKLRA